MERRVTCRSKDLFGPAVVAGSIGLWLAEISAGGLGGFWGFWIAFLGYFLARAMVIRIVRQELARVRSGTDAH